MSDTATEPTATPTPDPEPVAPVDELGDAGKRALAAERTARKAAEKAAADAAAKVKEYEDAQKSEAERLAAKVSELEARAAKAEADALRQRIVSEAGIPADLADLVSGADEATMRATADRLKAHIAPPRFAGTANQGPQNVDAGTGPKQLFSTAGMTPAQIEAARAAGQFNDLMAGKKPA